MGAVGLGALSTGGGSVAPSSSSGDSTAGVNAGTSLVFGGSGRGVAQSDAAPGGGNAPIFIAIAVVGVVAIVLALKK